MSVSRELKRRVGRYEPCLPRLAKEPPAGSGWIHEIKHDGFRILAELNAGRVKLITRKGFDLAPRFPPAVAVMLCAFHLLELDGVDLRREPIEVRKRTLSRLLRHKHAGISLNRHFDMEGAVIYRHACALGCEGIVSKQLGSPYRPGRQDCWVRIQNPDAPAVNREAEEDWV